MTVVSLIAAAMPSLAIALAGVWLAGQVLRNRRPAPVKVRTADRDRSARR